MEWREPPEWEGGLDGSEMFPYAITNRILITIRNASHPRRIPSSVDRQHLPPPPTRPASLLSLSCRAYHLHHAPAVSRNHNHTSRRAETHRPASASVQPVRIDTDSRRRLAASTPALCSTLIDLLCCSHAPRSSRLSPLRHRHHPLGLTRSPWGLSSPSLSSTSPTPVSDLPIAHTCTYSLGAAFSHSQHCRHSTHPSVTTHHDQPHFQRPRRRFLARPRSA